jgi:hypothetical protein
MFWRVTLKPRIAVFASLLLISLASVSCSSGSVSYGRVDYGPPTGAFYVGQIRNGIPYGQGTFTYGAGHVYVGEHDGLPEGLGTFTYANGDVFVGEVDFVPDGQGTQTYVDGRVQNGIFSRGVFIRANNIATPVVPRN